MNGEKKMHNPDGKVYAPLVWDFFQVFFNLFDELPD